MFDQDLHVACHELYFADQFTSRALVRAQFRSSHDATKTEFSLAIKSLRNKTIFQKMNCNIIRRNKIFHSNRNAEIPRGKNMSMEEAAKEIADY